MLNNHYFSCFSGCLTLSKCFGYFLEVETSNIHNFSIILPTFSQIFQVSGISGSRLNLNSESYSLFCQLDHICPYKNTICKKHCMNIYYHIIAENIWLKNANDGTNVYFKLLGIYSKLQADQFCSWITGHITYKRIHFLPPLI